MVISSFFICSCFVREIVPPTANTIVLLPDFSIAQRRVPSEPSSLREVTVYTVPPAPPVVSFPAPSAPGKAAIVERSGAGYSGNGSSPESPGSVESPGCSAGGLVPCSGFSSEQAVSERKMDARKAPNNSLFMALVFLFIGLYSHIVFILWGKCITKKISRCAIFVFHIVFFVIRFGLSIIKCALFTDFYPVFIGFLTGNQQKSL